jgi:hypothetical protein
MPRATALFNLEKINKYLNKQVYYSKEIHKLKRKQKEMSNNLK